MNAHKELYRLTEWGKYGDVEGIEWKEDGHYWHYTPDFLASKMPDAIENEEFGFSYRLTIKKMGNGFVGCYQNHSWVEASKRRKALSRLTDKEREQLGYWQVPLYGYTLSDLLCVMNIQLLKQGILTKESA